MLLLDRKNFWYFWSRWWHPFHLVDSSFFPFLVGTVTFTFVEYLVGHIHQKLELLVEYFLYGGMLSFFLILLSAILEWFTTILIEATKGWHTFFVQKGLKFGILLFIVSEVMLFFAFFWAYFHYSLAPSYAIGCIWPPKDTQKLIFFGIPLFNTLLLISSGITITFSHVTLRQYLNFFSSKGFFLTIILGTIFLWTQLQEYQDLILFTWNGDLFGSTFFVTTGFHGSHVTIGAILLIYNFFRYCENSLLQEKIWFLKLFMFIYFFKNIYVKLLNFFYSIFLPNQHLGYEGAAWYWHFVDVVWIFLYLVIYGWGGNVSLW